MNLREVQGYSVVWYHTIPLKIGTIEMIERRGRIKVIWNILWYYFLLLQCDIWQRLHQNWSNSKQSDQ